MAVLTTSEKQKLRNKAEELANKVSEPIRYTKGQVNSSFQALEDWFEVDATGPGYGKNKARVQIGTVLEDDQPGVYTNQAKKVLAAAYLELKAIKEINSI